MYLAISNLLLIFLFHVFVPTQATDPLHLEIKVTNPTCAGTCDGNVMLSVTGGQPGYRFAWSNGLKSQNYYDACAGTGEVTVSDIGGNTATISYALIDPPPIGIEKMLVKQPTAGLSDGRIEIDVIGGLLPYQFSLDGVKYSTSNIFSGLAPDNYVINIKDSNGCIVQSGTIILKTERDLEDLKTAYHLYYNEETKIIHMYSNAALTLELTDLQGRKMFEEELNKEHNIPIDDIYYGVYILKISDGVKTTYEKIVKASK